MLKRDGGEHIFVWNAIDIDNKEILGVYVSRSRCSIDTLRLVRRVLRYLEPLARGLQIFDL